MKKMNLVRLNHAEPDMKLLKQMREYFDYLSVAHTNFTEEEWYETVCQLVAFQACDGSFNLLDSNRIESDCAVYYCYEPTYIGTSILMKAFLNNKNLLTGKEDIILSGAMHACCERQLQGHGCDRLRDMIKAIYYFIDCDVKRFIEDYPNICPEFNMMFADIMKKFAMRVEKKEFVNEWGVNYKDEILGINDYFSRNVIFVYGTLLKGQANHDYYLHNSEYLGDGRIVGFEMFDLGSFPGIIVGDGSVPGEVYLVTDAELSSINRLEGEGDLYLKTNVKVSLDSGKSVHAAAYVYNRSVAGCKRLTGKYGTDEYVWYVSYGSNLLEERLAYYIKGGFCSYNNREYSPCNDTTMPIESRPVTIPYDMYYANYNMGSWKNSAVCFLDLSHEGKSFGRAYKIKKTQLHEIHKKEGDGVNWYPECIRLEDIDGVEAYTFAGYNVKVKEPFSRVSAEYGIVLFNGMKECYPEMSNQEIFDYLKKK